MRKLTFIIVVLFFHLLSFISFGQTIVSVVPNSGTPGNVISSVITGQNTLFMNGSPMGINSIYLGNNDCVNAVGSSINVIDDEHLNVDFTIPPALGNGSYDLHIITNDQSQYFLAGGFNVTGGTTYGLTSVSPDTVHENATLNATITGTDLQSFFAAGNAQVSLENGAVSIPGTSVVVVNATTITVDFFVPGYSIDANYDIRLTGNAGCLKLSQSVHVISASTRNLVSVTPNTANAGTILSAVVTGQDLYFMSGTPQNGIGSIYLENSSCNRYYATGLNPTDEDHMSVNFSFPANATNGFYAVYANSLAGDSYSLPNAVSLSGGVDRLLQSLSVNTGVAGSYIVTRLTGLGLDDILSGTNVSIWLSGPNVTVHDSVHTLISPTQLDIGFLLPIYGGNNFYDLHVSSSKGCFKLSNAFQITGGAYRGLISMQPNSANRAEQLTAVLTGQYAYFFNSTSPSINFQEANGSFQFNVGAASVTYIDTDHVSMDFVVPPTAPAGFYNVRAGLTALNDSLTLMSGFEIFGYVASGRVFLDLDSNGVFNTGEIYLANKRVILLPDSIVTFTDNNGNYFLPVDNGMYTIACVLDSDWSVTSVPVTQNITVNGGDFYGLDFGIKPNHPEASCEISIAPDNPRCLTVRDYRINYTFYSTDTLTAYITMVMDSNLNFSSSVPSPVSVNGDTVTWSFQILPVIGSGMLNCYVQMPAISGTHLTTAFHMEIRDGSGNSIAESIDTLRQTVTCSYDPNDKSVNPQGIDAANYTLVGMPLTYQIRFQNTGNDTAYFVHILDTIDSGLDLNTFQFLSSSHPVQVLIHPNRVVDFRFDQIMLPDSNIDEAGSHGYVLYRIRPNQQLQLPYELSNTGNIYFDFNSPVATNTTLNTLVETIPVGIPAVHVAADGSIRLYPNPTSKDLYIEFDQSVHDRMLAQIFDYKGSLVIEQTVYGENAKLTVSNLNAGLYMLVVTDSGNGHKTTARFIKY
ncbi:MAG TPA: T9SS type A sorting domain-containing protein [Bacteroidia bacterium]|nr:T9SS type A sorting domain-containing protein [Bacteroidia bacterium]